MNKSYYFLAALSAIIIIFPGIVVIGLFFFVAPGLFLMFVLPIFEYWTAYLGVKWMLTKIYPKYTILLSMLVTLSIGFAISGALNYLQIKNINPIASNDTHSSEPVNSLQTTETDLFVYPFIVMPIIPAGQNWTPYIAALRYKKTIHQQEINSHPAPKD